VSFSDINSLRNLPYASVMVDHSLQIWPQMPAATAADNADSCFLPFHRLA